MNAKTLILVGLLCLLAVVVAPPATAAELHETIRCLQNEFREGEPPMPVEIVECTDLT